MLGLEIDEEELQLTCGCCGRPVRWMQGFVHIDENTSAMYSATISSAHRDRRIHLVLGMGDWSDDGDARDRVAFAAQVWVGEQSGEPGLVTGFVDVGDVIIPPPKEWGDFRSAEEMRKVGRGHDVFELIDHILASDPRLVKYVIEDMRGRA